MLIAQRPTIEAVDSEKNDNQKFAIGPLEPGFGQTLGNSLRRILLSSLGGAAITNVKLEGVNHEFSTISGVREDLTDIILNLKDVVVNSLTDQPVVLSVEVKGEKKDGTVVTAEALNTNAEIEILNPDLPIATLNKDAVFAGEVTVAVGRGYVPAASIPQTTIGQISVDAIFSPIRRVAISVEPVQVEESIDHDRLILDIHTDGTISPKDALSSAASTLKGLSELIEEFGEGTQGLEFVEVVEEEPKELIRNILDLQLSERAYNCLDRAGIETVGQLIVYSVNQLMEIPNFGKKSLDEVIEKLDAIGLALEGEGEGEEEGEGGDEEGADGEAADLMDAESELDEIDAILKSQESQTTKKQAAGTNTKEDKEG